MAEKQAEVDISPYIDWTLEELDQYPCIDQLPDRFKPSKPPRLTAEEEMLYLVIWDKN